MGVVWVIDRCEWCVCGVVVCDECVSWIGCGVVVSVCVGGFRYF